MTQNLTAAQRLLALIDQSPTAYHAADNLRREFERSGFSLYDPDSELQAGDRRYFSAGGASLFAFTVGTDALMNGFQLIGTHLDGPGLKIKPNSLVEQAGCLCLNTEVYGGPILHTWFDRPLSIAGQVVMACEDHTGIETRLVDMARPILILPSLAIHMDRDVNTSHGVDRVKTLLPVAGIGKKPDGGDWLFGLLAEQLQVDESRILDTSLFLYDTAPGCLMGRDNEMISASRLDNLGMAAAAADAMIAAAPAAGIQLAAFFDHEEVGSQTRQGANSATLAQLMEQIVYSLGGSRRDYLAALKPSFLLSADQAHAQHPHYPEMADRTNQPRINGGPAIKISASQSYVSDAESMAVIRAICRKAEIPCQTYANRSDQRGGSTIGPLTVQRLPVRAVDIGNPIWGMHSVRETGGTMDQQSMQDLMGAFLRYVSLYKPHTERGTSL